MKVNGKHQLLVMLIMLIRILSRSVHNIKKITEALVVANKNIELKGTVGETKYMAISEIRIQDEVKI